MCYNLVVCVELSHINSNIINARIAQNYQDIAQQSSYNGKSYNKGETI